MQTDTQAAGENQDPKNEDTLDTQQSEASKASDSQESEEPKGLEEAPEANQGEVEEGNPDETGVNAEDTADDTLLAGKYKTPEELERAYKELESKFGKETGEKAKLSRTLDTVLSPEQDTGVGVSETEALRRDTAVLKFLVAHNDVDADSMKEILSSDPLLNQISGHEAKLEYAYLRSKELTRDQAMAQVQKQAQNETKAKVAEKEAAKVESAKKAEPVDDGTELLNKATSGSQEERQAARLALYKKHLADL